ncbi:hypothetical protein ACGFRB_29045 [Streptomyces sp. NPDC048718]|uniref:hypothetical protein n=1 Tax=Streptomyces sp. NPDC048718 TaxID=3365587 RepID=UPI003720F84D
MTIKNSRATHDAYPADLTPIIPAESPGETRKTHFDLRVCGSLLVVIGLTVVVIIIVVTRPPAPELWPLAVPLLLPFLVTARRSTLRLVRTRRA